MKTFKATISGPAVVMHNGQLADPRNPYAKAIKEISSKKKKSDEDYEELARREYQGSLYHDDEVGPYLPGEAVQAMIVEGARKSKLGREFVSVMVEEEIIPLEYSGPRTRDALWKDSKFVLAKLVKVNNARVLRTRPLIRNWKATFTIAIDDDATINPSDVEHAIAIGGSKVGLLDWRPGSPKGGRYGRFSLDEFVEVKDSGKKLKKVA